MARLSSCYFCGTAIDAPLKEYPVVPRELDPTRDRDETVVLCPACHRKLSTVLERVMDAVDDRDRPTVHEAPGGEGAAGANSPVGREPLSFRDDGPADADDGDDEYEPVFERSAEDAGESGDRDAVFAPPPEGRLGSESDGPADDNDDAAHDDDPGPATESVVTEAESTDEGPDEPLETGRQPSEEGRDAAPEGERTGGSGVGGASGPSARTYNRVVRLLQNREFPVQRAEIEEVATNAYDISPADFDAVIDTAVERGVLAEEGGQLRSP